MGLSLLVLAVFCSSATAQDRRRLPPPPVFVEPAPTVIEAPHFTTQMGDKDKKEVPTPIIRTGARKDELDITINPELPGPERLFERFSERQVFERIKVDARKRPGSPAIVFPDEPPVTHERYTGRNFTRSVATVEPSYVCHGRLLFEQRNFERYGWDLGVLDPGVQVGKFCYDLVLLPYHYWTDPWQHWDCSAGKCLPGDPVPLLLYREKFSLTGLAAQGTAVGLGLWVIP